MMPIVRPSNKNKSYWNAAIKAKDIYENNGCGWNLLTSKEINELDPALDNIQGILGGAWTPSDFTGDIYKFCTELEKILIRKYRVHFFYGNSIDNIKTIDHYDQIVIANGVGSVRLSRSFGDDLPIYPVKGYSITINNVDPEYLPRVSLLDDQAKIVTSTLGNRFRVAGTAELTGENYDICQDRINPLLKWVHTNFPNIDTTEYTSWACLRPMTPDMMPIVRPSNKNKKVYYHTGHGHLGWTLSPVTAKMLVNLMEQ